MAKSKVEKDLEQQILDLQKYRFDLQEKLRVAVNRLTAIADGSYFTGECEGLTDQSSRLKRTAAEGLKILALMKERRI